LKLKKIKKIRKIKKLPNSLTKKLQSQQSGKPVTSAGAGTIPA